jgi:5'-nucleotidase
LSGTVGAALDGRNLKYPSIAVSVASFEISDFSFAAKFVAKVLDNLENLRIEDFQILNINIPDHNEFPDPEIKITKTFLNDEECDRNLNVSDRKNLNDGFISISPIKIDMHSNSQQEVVADWAKNL